LTTSPVSASKYSNKNKGELGMPTETLNVFLTDEEIMSIIKSHLEKVYGPKGWEFWCLSNGELPKELGFDFSRASIYR
jgi:hypothetical protein